MPIDAAIHAAPSAGAAATGPTPIPKAVLCPYCGHLSMNTGRCESCRGYFDPLSRQASQNSMGPWFIRDETNPRRPGCAYDTLCALVRRGKVGAETVLRGPTTRQFWTFARNTPGVAHLLGECHNCHAAAAADDRSCDACGAEFGHTDDRQHLGLAPVHLLPGHTSPEIIAASTLRTPLAPVVVAPVEPVRAAAPVAVRTALPRELLTPALDRVTAPGAAMVRASRKRRDGTMVWVGIGVGAALLTALLALALNSGRASRAERVQPTGQSAVSTPPSSAPSENPPPKPAEPAPAQPQDPQELGAAHPPAGAADVARLLARPDGSGLAEAAEILRNPEHPAAHDLAGFPGILRVRQDQARLANAL